MVDEDELKKHLPTAEELQYFFERFERDLVYEDALQRLIQKRESQSRAIYPLDIIAVKAVERWEKDDMEFYICESPVWREFEVMKNLNLPGIGDAFKVGRWNGYVKFRKFPGIVPGRDGIYRYVPVHGGITFYQEWADGSFTFGFDTAHAFSELSPIYDLNYIRAECERLGRNIKTAARFEPYYLKVGDDKRKTQRIVDRMERFLV